MRFDCSKLIKAVKVEGARDGEKQWRWQPLRCQDACGQDGDADDCRAVMGGTWGPSCFAHDDRVFVVDLEASPNEFERDGWRARSGVV